MNAMLLMHRQRGLTLIEIMVALVISLFLLVGLLQLFIGTRQSARVQENLSRVQENGRFAINFVGRNIRLAGYRSGSTFEFVQIPKLFEEKFPGVRAVQGTNDDGVNGSDTITVNFEGERAGHGNIRNCLNEQINDSVTSNNIFSINTNASGKNELRCQSGAGTETILEDVENMQILYGVSSPVGESGVASRYVPANDVGGNWDRVVSLRISLLVRTSEDNLVASPQPYSFNGATVIPTDRRLRRVFTTTITLRNRV